MNFHEDQRSTKISTTASNFPHFVEITTLVATLAVTLVDWLMASLEQLMLRAVLFTVDRWFWRQSWIPDQAKKYWLMTDFGVIAKRALGAPKSVGAIAFTQLFGTFPDCLEESGEFKRTWGSSGNMTAYTRYFSQWRMSLIVGPIIFLHGLFESEYRVNRNSHFSVHSVSHESSLYLAIFEARLLYLIDRSRWSRVCYKKAKKKHTAKKKGPRTS